MPLRPDVAAVFRDYPRIYFACHRQHVRDPASGALVSSRQVSILDHLDAVAPMMLTDLASHMGVTPATMSLAVEALVQAGYIARAADPIDRRKTLLRLTPAGVKITAASSVLEPTLVEEMLDQLSATDRRAALRGLALLGQAAGAASVRRSAGKRSSAK